MKKELDEALVRDFPNLYRRRGDSPSTTGMCWGFQCGSGWEPLIRELSQELEQEILKVKEKHGEDVSAQLTASCVKEKFGTLRFYMDYETEKMSWLIDLYECVSAHTCEDCGSNEGILSSYGGWISVKCDKCWNRNFAARFIDTVKAYSKIGVKVMKYGSQKGQEIPAVIVEDEEKLTDSLTDRLASFSEMKLPKPTYYRYSQLTGIAGWFDNLWRKTLCKVSFLKYKWWWKQQPQRFSRFMRYNLWFYGRVLSGKRVK